MSFGTYKNIQIIEMPLDAVAHKRAVTGFLPTRCPLSRKSNNLSAKRLLLRKGYNLFDVYVFVQPRFFSDNCISQSAEYSGTRQRRIVRLPYDYLNRHT